MKITLALALVLFVLYLAGCDFVGANASVQNDHVLKQNSVISSEQDHREHEVTGAFHMTSPDTSHNGR